MSVNWLWKSKVGEIIYKDEKTNKRWKLEMYTGNMMCCFIYNYVKEEEGKKTKMYNFFTWWNDIEHAKRFLKETKLEDMALGKHKVIKVRLNISKNKIPYSKKEMIKLAEILVCMGYKMELY